MCNGSRAQRPSISNSSRPTEVIARSDATLGAEKRNGPALLLNFGCLHPKFAEVTLSGDRLHASKMQYLRA